MKDGTGKQQTNRRRKLLEKTSPSPGAGDLSVLGKKGEMPRPQSAARYGKGAESSERPEMRVPPAEGPRRIPERIR